MKNYYKIAIVLLSIAFATTGCKKSNDVNDNISGGGNSGGGAVNNPTIVTCPVSDITAHSAKAFGCISEDSGLTIEKRGICWSLHDNPSVYDNTVYCGTGTGSFNCLISYLLQPNTTYYVKAYAKTENGIKYGNCVSFTTERQSNYDVELTNRLGGTRWSLVKNVDYNPNGTVTTTYPYNYISYGATVSDIYYNHNGYIQIGGLRKGDWYFEDGKLFIIYDSNYTTATEQGELSVIYGHLSHSLQLFTNSELVYYKTGNGYRWEHYFTRTY